MREKKALNIEIGNNIRRERERAHLTQEALSEMIDMGTSNFSDVERGLVGISLTTLKKLCVALHIPSDRILFGIDSDNDTTALAEYLGRLTPEQYEIVNNSISNLLKAFSLKDSSNNENAE